MAVARDSHRDFLIPERTVTQYARQLIKYQMICFLFLYFIITYFRKKSIRLRGGKKKITHPAKNLRFFNAEIEHKSGERECKE